MQTFQVWFAAAMLSFFVMTIVLSEGWLPRGAVAYALTAVTIVLIVGAARAYIVFLRGADELLRKIQVEALAFSFAAGTVFMMSWRLCERLGAPKLDVNDPFLLMVIVWAIAQYVGFRRYSFVGTP